MKQKTIATISLREGAHDLEETLREACQWVEAAAVQGADLAVLPETINLLRRADHDTPLEAFALNDWRTETAMLCQTAATCGIALVLPLLVRERGVLANRFYLLAKDGTELGFYQKTVPAVGERELGIEPGNPSVLCWEGLRIGGAICIDVYFPRAVIESQMDAGADLFVVPSMTPAGVALDANAVAYGVPFVLAYSPWSRILDRDGTELAAGGYRSETLRAGFGSPVVQATVNFDAVSLFADLNQDKMCDVQRHYGSKVRVRFDQANCIFVLESVSADLAVTEVMHQFGLVSRRDYFARLANLPATIAKLS